MAKARPANGAIGTLLVSDVAAGPWSWEWGSRENPLRPFEPENCYIIAGTRGHGLGRLIAPDLPQPHDGVVALAETVIPGVTRRIELKIGHTEMLLSREVARQCCAFLRSGQFA